MSEYQVPPIENGGGDVSKNQKKEKTREMSTQEISKGGK